MLEIIVWFVFFGWLVILTADHLAEKKLTEKKVMELRTEQEHIKKLYNSQICELAESQDEITNNQIELHKRMREINNYLYTKVRGKHVKHER